MQRHYKSRTMELQDFLKPTPRRDSRRDLAVSATPSAKQKQRRLSDEQIDELVERFNAGMPAYALAPEYGIARNTVLAHLKRRGVATRKGPATQAASR